LENLLFSFNVMLPLIVEIMIGFFLRFIGVITESTAKGMNKIVFKLFLPVMIFYNLYTSELSTAFNSKLIIFAECSIIILAVLLCIIVPIFEKDNKKRGVIIQAIFRSNFAIFGIPLATALSTEDISGTASVLIACVVVTFNVLAVVVLESFSHGKANFGKIAKGIVTNPLIIASIIGIIFLVFGIKLPNPIEKTVSSLSSVATPLGLVVLGSFIDFKVIKSNLKQIVWSVSGKLVIVPTIFLTVSYLMGFKGGVFAILIAVFASPTAVSSFAMADQMGQDGELAAQILMLTTFICSFTVFGFILVFKTLGAI